MKGKVGELVSSDLQEQSEKGEGAGKTSQQDMQSPWG